MVFRSVVYKIAFLRANINNFNPLYDLERNELILYVG